MFCIEKLDKRKHDRNSFVSTNATLNEYLKKYSSQDLRNNLSTTYVAVPKQSEIPKRIYGYFSINPFSLSYQNGISLNMAPYGYLPALLIGRLAIDKNQNDLKGYQLLWGALRFCLQVDSNIAVNIIVVDPIDEKAKKFYLRQGFQFISSSNERMYIPVKLIRKIIAQISAEFVKEESQMIDAVPV